MRIATSTAVVEVSKMYRASSKAVVESALSRRPGVLSVDVNPVAQTATVIFDPDVTSIAWPLGSPGGRLAEVLPEDKSAKVAELQRGGRRVAMVGDRVNDAPPLAQADLGVAIGAGADVAIETADVVLMRSDPLDVPVALRIGKGTLRKERQNLAWAIGYNAIALPIAAGVFEPAYGVMLSPEIAALTMSGSSFLVAVNALLLKRLRLPGPTDQPLPAPERAPEVQTIAAG
jgi:cation transport ATPase